MFFWLQLNVIFVLSNRASTATSVPPPTATRLTP